MSVTRNRQCSLCDTTSFERPIGGFAGPAKKDFVRRYPKGSSYNDLASLQRVMIRMYVALNGDVCHDLVSTRASGKLRRPGFIAASTAVACRST